ncbi:hypothetical protein ON010_g12552 [Phytophthora cinnamomi]|nr:hypothetical protein ON010_g12552 [Phytophthora cinnamomi]
MDETGLCYAMSPVRSICTENLRGVKKSKSRITLVLASNASESGCLPPLYLGYALKLDAILHQRAGRASATEYYSFLAADGRWHHSGVQAGVQTQADTLGVQVGDGCGEEAAGQEVTGEGSVRGGPVAGYGMEQRHLERDADTTHG